MTHVLSPAFSETEKRLDILIAEIRALTALLDERLPAAGQITSASNVGGGPAKQQHERTNDEDATAGRGAVVDGDSVPGDRGGRAEQDLVNPAIPPSPTEAAGSGVPAASSEEVELTGPMGMGAPKPPRRRTRKKAAG